MSEAVYDMVNVNGEPECEEPLGSTELYEHQYIELEQPEGVYDMARVAELTFLDGKRRNSTESHEPQYMQIQQKESTYDKSRVVEQIQQNVFDKALMNTESQYMELQQLEDVYDTVRVSERKVSCRIWCAYYAKYCTGILAN